MRPLLTLPAILLAATPALSQSQNPLAETFDAVPDEFDEIPIQGLTVERLVDTPLIGENDDKIGTIENVIIVEDAPDKLVVSLGGFTELSTRKVLFELADVTIEETDDGTLRATTPLTQDAIDRLSEYDSA